LVPTSYVTQGPSPDNGELWYAVLKGKSVGLTQNNAVALHAVVGVSNNQMKSFKSLKKALFAFNHALDIGLIEIRPF
jgi:viroplasmin and RNaseH domain-containing protein